MTLFKKIWLLLGIAGLVQAASAQTHSLWNYKILQKITAPGDTGWDYLKADSGSRRLYVTRDKAVQVFDLDTYQLLGTITGLDHCHGIALAPPLNRGFISNGGGGTIVEFDLETLRRTAEVKAQKGADAVLYDPSTGLVFSFNGDSENSTVLDPAAGKVVATLDLGGKPEFAAADGKGNIFDNLEDKSLVLRIDAKTLKITGRWPLPPGSSPAGMAIDSGNNRLFVGCRNKTLVILDSASGKVVQTLPIGEHEDAAAFDPDSATVFNSCGDGTLNLIHEDSPDQYSTVQILKTEPGCRTLAFDSKTGNLFLPTAQFEPPAAPSAENPKPRPKMIPGTFRLLVAGPGK